MMKLPLSIVAVGFLTLGSVSPAVGQASAQSRPYRGLFGSDIGETEQLLTATASLGGGYDDNVLADAAGGVDPRAARGGATGLFSGGLTYRVDRGRVGLGASLSTSGRYYPQLSEPFVSAHQGSVDAVVQLARGTNVRAGHTVNYQPFTLIAVFAPIAEPLAGEGVLPEPDLAAGRDDYLSSATTMAVDQRLSSRASIGVTLGYRRSESLASGGDFASRHAGSTFRYSVSRGFGVRLGYGYTGGLYRSSDRRVEDHSVDAGIDYAKALSITRRTTLSFGTGTAAVRSETHIAYRLTGNARLNHDIGRTWSASLAYSRGFEFTDTLQEPVFADAIAASVGGLINRRLQFTSNARASIGHVGVARGGSQFNTYSGSIGLAHALSRFVQASVAYVYYHYRFPGGVLPPGVPDEINRNSVRAQLTVWAPVFHRARRP